MNARQAAARAVAAVLSGRALDQALLELNIDSGQRPFAQAVAYTCVRHLGSARELLRKLLSQPDRPRPPLLDALVMCALTEIRHLSTPTHAAVAENVGCARELGMERQSGLINALLRRYLRERDALDAALERDPVARHEHPLWWIERVRQDWPNDAERILGADDLRAPLWLRINRQRGDRPAMLQRLQDAGMQGTAHPNLPDALRVDPPVPVEQLPGFALGMLSVQDAAAQRVIDWVEPAPGQRVLDACSAPGGKTAHLLERCPEIELLALDIDAQRLEKVRENLTRLGLKAELRCAHAAKTEQWWDGRPFDRILIDAPCTGSGVARRHPDIKWLRRSTDPEQLAQTQLGLIRALWPLLAEGGRLIYTTCSVFRSENQGVIAEFLDGLDDDQAAIAQPWRPQSVQVSAWMPHGMQVLPGQDDEDGFYYAAIVRARAEG